MNQSLKKFVIVVSIASVGGYIGHILNLPIGILMGSFITVAIAKISGLKVPPLKKKYKQMIQMLVGGLIGLNLQPDIVSLFFNHIVPGLIATVFHLLFAFLIAYIFTKLFRFKWLTALSGSLPAGMSEISIVADEIDVDVEVVMLMHLFRISLLILILPVIIKLLLL
ncbi:MULTISPECIES: AbrB family transcriptional regulator [Oceanobacillus]|uniref:Putative ammonia monooxygenase n=1 Tax=Oceanobacillus oncorhynchi TaxID=545501 RepID=A0A0A1MQJ0_9BACI|nr:AbrB family transcriptional regulator [Oceanobacillus oncorhynchi]UUI40476.1 AbrB family transcriptional regulator [Oceanobacillus oncorhynchi]CEI81897.1 Putative ammonia monooxygenase [Oceanobacillus oncorhynchi]